MAYWLLKTEPETFSWDDLVRDGKTEWDGVRNPTARLNLRAMKLGDRALIYHSGAARDCVGVGEISREHRPDGPDGKWASVEVVPVAPLLRPVTLAAMKTEPRLADMIMLRQSRLSVAPVSDAEWAVILDMAGGTK